MIMRNDHPSMVREPVDAVERGVSARSERRSTTTQTVIVRAAGICFARWGVPRTKMGDIARELGIARPSLYRFYDSKQALVHAVMLAEHQQLNDLRRRAISLEGPVVEIILASIAIGWRLVKLDAGTRFLADPDNFEMAATLRASAEMGRIRRSFWFDVFDHGRSRGELRADLDNEELLLWVTSVQAMFLEDAATFPDEDSVREAVRRFVIPALVVGCA
jgi:AcrR family transcriptional regulator